MVRTPVEIWKHARATGQDPVVELVELLKRRAHPPKVWLERWSAEGHEPVAAAWSASRSPEALLALLALAGRDEDLTVAARAAGVLQPGDPPFGGENLLDQVEEAGWYTFFGFGEDVHQRALGAIRQAVAKPPTLEELAADLRLTP